MKGNSVVITYLIALVVFLIIDFIWLGFIAKNLYFSNIGHLLAPKANLVAAFIFYVLFIGGLLYFAILPGIAQNSLKVAVMNAAIYGFMTYATYDLTNQATMKDWPLKVTIIDLIWGTVISSVVTYITFNLQKFF